MACRKKAAPNSHIAAPTGQVGGVLTDRDHYPECKPYRAEVEGQLTVGENLAVTIQKPNGDQLIIEPHVRKIVSGRKLSWGGSISGLFYGERLRLGKKTLILKNGKKDYSAGDCLAVKYHKSTSTSLETTRIYGLP